jgi:hypothetical protein
MQPEPLFVQRCEQLAILLQSQKEIELLDSLLRPFHAALGQRYREFYCEFKWDKWWDTRLSFPRCYWD